MIETKVFADINQMNPIELMTMEANATVALEQKSKRSWFRRLFRKKQVREHFANMWNLLEPPNKPSLFFIARSREKLVRVKLIKHSLWLLF